MNVLFYFPSMYLYHSVPQPSLPANCCAVNHLGSQTLCAIITRDVCVAAVAMANDYYLSFSQNIFLYHLNVTI